MDAKAEEEFGSRETGKGLTTKHTKYTKGGRSSEQRVVGSE
jgi:hypothetical protein